MQVITIRSFYARVDLFLMALVPAFQVIGDFGRFWFELSSLT